MVKRFTIAKNGKDQPDDNYIVKIVVHVHFRTSDVDGNQKSPGTFVLPQPPDISATCQFSLGVRLSLSCCAVHAVEAGKESLETAQRESLEELGVEFPLEV